MLFKNEGDGKKDDEKLVADSDRSGCNYVSGNGVYILGDFDESISRNIIPSMNSLIEEQKAKVGGRINFYINSHGGLSRELYGLLTFIDLAKASGVVVSTTVLGYAYSCGSLLAVVGDERRMSRYAHHLMHLGYSGEHNSTYEQLKRNNKRQREFFDMTVGIYAANTKMRLPMIRKNMMDDCFYLNAEECLKYGFVDEII